MEFFDEQMIEFLWFGIYANIISIFVTFAVTLFKAFSLKEDEIDQFRQFAKMRSYLIGEYNSSFKIYAAFALNLIPLYLAVLNTWYMLHVIFIPGVRGLIVGAMKSDNLSLIQLVRYEVVKIRDK